MKKFFIAILIGFLFMPGNSFAVDKSQIKEHLKRMNKEDFRNFFSSHKKYKAFDENIKSLVRKNQLPVRAKENITTQKSAQLELPAERYFPAEFEEVQAILIGWPYYSFDKEMQIQYPLEQLFDGKALYYDFVKQEYKLIDVVNVPDVFDDSEYAYIYATLADAIQKEAQVWINVWSAEDTTDILEYAASVGKPLYNYRFFVNPGNSFWYRDCGPVGFYYGDQDSIAFLDFEYYGGRPLDDEIPVKVGKELGIPVYSTTIEFEGGNILVDGDGTLFTTNAIVDANADGEGRMYLDESSPLGFSVEEKPVLTLAQVRDSLAYLMNLKRIKILDRLQYDGGTGHIDLYADFYDENTFVFTKYPSELSSFFDSKLTAKNIDTLLKLTSRNGKKYLSRSIPLPRKDDGTWYKSSKEYERYTRTYSNHLFVNKTIIQPVFYTEGVGGSKSDFEEAMTALTKAYPGYNIVPIDVRSFDGSGGAIHCITKQIPADNPLRIFHYPVSAADLFEDGYRVDAEITNRSGIKNAKVYWKRSYDENWNSAPLQKDENNKFTGFIPNSALNEGDTVVYYIYAESNNGKSITKPIVAPQGNYQFVVSYVSVRDNSVSDDEVSEVFPNPANEFASIEFRNIKAGKVKISIINSTGVQVYANTVDLLSQYDVITINTSKLPVGLYYLNISFDDRSSIMRKMSIVR